MSDLTVLFVHYEWPGVTDCGGSGRVAKQLRERLQQRGHDCPLVTDPADGHYLTFPARRRGAIERALTANEPDVVYAGSSLPTAVGLPTLCNRHDAALVVKTMGSDVHNPNNFQRIRPLLDRVNAWIFEAADSVICQSEAMADHVRRWTEPIVVANGIDTDRYSWTARSLHDPIRILTVGRIAPIKQIGLGIRAVDHLRSRGYDAKYRIVGDGSERERLARAHDHDWVEWTGWVDDPREDYDWADLFLLPSSHESFGMVLLEALASGVPCVTTDTGGQAEVVEGAVGQAVAPDRDGLARALATVAASYQATQRATKGYVAEKFSLTRMVDKFEAVFTRVARAPTLTG